MRALWLLLVCCQTSAWAGSKVLVTASARVGLSQKIATALLGRVEAVLTGEGLLVKQATQSCEGERTCLVALAKSEGQQAVVAVALVMSLKSIVVDLEAVSAASGTVLSQANFKLKGPDAPLPESVTAFARGIAEQLELEAKSAQVADAPLKALLAPPPPVPSLSLPLTPSPSRAPVVITGVAAGAALIASAILVGVGAATQAELPPRDSSRPPLTPERAQQLVDGANTAYTGAAIAGGTAGALGVAAIILGVASP